MWFCGTVEPELVAGALLASGVHGASYRYHIEIRSTVRTRNSLDHSLKIHDRIRAALPEPPWTFSYSAMSDPGTTPAWETERDFEDTVSALLRVHIRTTRKTFGYPISCTPGPCPQFRSYHCDHLRLAPSRLPPLELTRVLRLPVDARREKKMAQEGAEEVYRRQEPIGRLMWELRMLEPEAGEMAWSGDYTPRKEVGFEREDRYGSGQREAWERRRRVGVLRGTVDARGENGGH